MTAPADQLRTALADAADLHQAFDDLGVFQLLQLCQSGHGSVDRLLGQIADGGNFVSRHPGTSERLFARGKEQLRLQALAGEEILHATMDAASRLAGELLVNDATRECLKRSLHALWSEAEVTDPADGLAQFLVHLAEFSNRLI